MKNRSCPNRYGCWDYTANNCEDCPIGKLIEKQKRKIARLTKERDKYEKRAIEAEHQLLLVRNEISKIIPKN